ncbi:hypothetical protein SteCoe_38202 [Stentor coeruleus]|uniref:Uncharacterized protein n=1 Tax=Stentor coeruleus TaxID=5963 RepID=A0A1R2ALS7_9CILI|nr:hypothetical protein SteCoe_38202 [Stentor coeruleus]
MTWNGTSIISYDYEIISMISLNLTSLTIMSIDGFYFHNLYIVVADYWHGLMVLIVKNGTKVMDVLPGDEKDPYVSICAVYRGLNIITKSGILKTYMLSYNMDLVFIENRYPFTTSFERVSLMSSFAIINNFYRNHYLIYPVFYNEIDMFFRVIDTTIEFSSHLVRDLPAEMNSNDAYIGFNYVTFISQTSFCFISNYSNIVFYSLNNLVIEKPSLSISEYNQMLKKWNTSSFLVEITGNNKNNQVVTKFNLNIKREDNKSYNDEDIGAWVFIVIILSTVLVLALSVKLAHKFFFSKKKKLTNDPNAPKNEGLTSVEIMSYIRE